ncbi:MAG: GntR family transcriptional regulator, partial [Cyanobacteria bacterium J06631_9]
LQLLCPLFHMSVPLHVSISEKLRQQISSGDYSPGEKLPSEHQLMKTFGVSRITVRQAVANLVSQGLVRSHQGKGVFVTPQVKTAYSLSSPLTFLEQDVASKGIKLTFDNLSFRKVGPPKGVRAALQLAARSEQSTDKPPMVYLQKKLLRMDGAVGAIDISYILLELGQKFGPRLKKEMTFPILETSGVPIETIQATIECTHADYDMSEHLEVSLGYPLIVYRYTAYTQNQLPVVHGETISRADRFCYSLTVRK